MSTRDDRSLRFYNEVLGLERLHYGLWLLDDEISMDNLRKAQERYDNYLVDNIPDGVKSVLDVGCGTGMLTAHLMGLGYHVEGLSPDISQKKNFTDSINAPFHHLSFEHFSATDQYDCIIMSESAQYIRIPKLFENAHRSLKKGGYLMVCDYFVLPNASGELSKSGHDYDAFMAHIGSNGFTVVSEEDITERVTQTLDLAKLALDRILIAIEIGTAKFRAKHAYLWRCLLWLTTRPRNKLERQMQLLDPVEFVRNKTYRFFLLQANS